MLGKRGFSFVYVLVFAIVSVSSAIVILLAYSIVSDTPLGNLVPDSLGNLIGSTNSNNQNNDEGFLGGFLGGLFGGNKQSSGGGGGGSSSSGTGGNPPGDNNSTNQTYLACVNNTCSIVNGSGTNQCLIVGAACNLVQCSDGLDNDGDYWTDVLDPGCTNLNDTDEINNFTIHQCSDGLDNDLNGPRDGADDNCDAWNDDLEGDEPIVSGNAEYITPGNGWNNQLIDTPLANGVGPTPIGRWDFVPYQTINNGEEIGIGIVAFHIYGIEKVLFSVENGSWTEVREMSYNPHSRVWEYWVKMRASDFDNDGLKEIRAIIYPKVGQPRVLQGSNLRQEANGIHSMFLNTNKNGNLLTHIRWVDSTYGDDATGHGTQNSPFKTIVVAARNLTVDYGSSDGGIIYLKAGDYYWGKVSGTLPSIVTNERWLTIRSAPGLDKNQVRINGTSASGLKTRLVKIEDVHVNNTVIHTSGSANSIWAENMLFTGKNLTDIAFPLQGDWDDGIYATGSEYSTMKRAIADYALARHVYVHDIGAVLFKQPRLLINATGESLIDANPGLGQTPNGTLPADVHRDVIFGQSGLNNTIIYGLKAVKNIDGQNFYFSCGASDPQNNCFYQDLAFVNLILDSKSDWPAKYGVITDHLLLWNFVETKKISFSALLDGWNTTGAIKTITYFDIRNSVFGQFAGQSNQHLNVNNGGTYGANNHFIEATSALGFVNSTTGIPLNSLFAHYTVSSATDNDFHPSINSILRGTNRPYSVQRVVPADFEGTEILSNGLGAIGALQ